MDSDKSLLATLRIILLFLKVYGQLHKRELKWFSHMLKTHLHNEGDREVIMKDFSRTTPLEDLIKDVQEDDKKRLLSWVRIAIWADGNLAPEESEFYN